MPVSPSPALRPVLARTAAALAAVTVIATACSSASPHRRSAPTTTPTTVAPTTTTTEYAPSYAPSPFAWDRSTSPALDLGGGAGTTLSAVLAPQLTGPWLMAGTRFSAAGAPTATVWTSPDATTWTATTLGTSGDLGQADGAAQYRGATVVVGSVGSGANQQAAAWLSDAPAAPFQSATVPLTAGPSGMSAVAGGALGMFATGTVDGRFALWSSTGGLDWAEVPSAEQVITSSPGAEVNSLLEIGSTIYAAGSVRRGPTEEAAVWTSGDGLHWRMVTTAATAFSGPGDRVIYSMAPLQIGLVAVGAVNLGSGWVPASWISPDGASWSQAATDFPGLPSPTGAGAVYGIAGGSAARSVSSVATLAGTTDLVATGGGPYGQEAWSSADGLHWTSLHLPPAVAASTGWRPGPVAATASSTVIVDSDPGRPYVLVDGSQGWSQPSTDPSVFGPVRPSARPVALTDVSGRLYLEAEVDAYPQSIGTVSVTQVVLSSTDGADWAPATTPPGLLPATVPAPRAVTLHLPGRWVAVATAADRRPQGWISATGAAWTSEGPLDPIAPSGSTTSPSTRPSTTAGPASASGLCSAGKATASADASASTTSPPSSTTPVTATTTPTTATPATASPTTASPTTASPATASPAIATPAVAAVGAAVTAATPGGTSSRVPAAWLSSGGEGWKRVPVGAPAGSGGPAAMLGCIDTPSGLVAYGASTGSGGAPEPALWHSLDGGTWTASPVSAFTVDSPHPLSALAADGATWLAAADPDPAAGAAGRTESASGVIGVTAPEVGPGASLDTDSLVGPAPSLEDGQDGLWLSSDAGGTWQLIDTSVAPWLGVQQASVSLVGFAGGGPVVAGVVDGRLAVWTGVPIPLSASSAASGSGS